MKKTALLVIACACFAATFIISSCNKDDNNNGTPPMATLYDSLGGTTMVTDPANPSSMIEAGRLGIRSVVDSAIFVIAADPELNVFFNTLLQEVGSGDLSGFSELSMNLTDFFCVATGAKDYSYTGLSMTDAHNPATNPRMNGKADNADFDQFIADVVVAAQKNGVPDNLINSLGAVIETQRSLVVQQ